VKIIIGVVVSLILFGALMAACTALINDEDSLGPVVVASHEYCYEDEPCGDDWGGGSDGNSGGRYEGGRSGDNDQRGDHNCRNFCFYGVPMPGGDGNNPPERGTMELAASLGGRGGLPAIVGHPTSLFPIPTPDGIRQFVLSTMQAGIGLGRLFADATIDFVSSILVGVA
jgi:hypothetical protein